MMGRFSKIKKQTPFFVKVFVFKANKGIKKCRRKSSQYLIGRVCQKLRSSGRLDPANPRIYNDVSIALLARQIEAVVVTTNISDFKKIHQVVDFKFRKVMLPL
ncbi:MAG: hypothetical protein JRD93_11605 [Deltaproteobacteria bacterium]|nr:hypothetical protein [Deltaproteobacteria bacterium]MBW2662605.1 hypothetical protein [Deltaproteobacteria bacterium]